MKGMYVMILGVSIVAISTFARPYECTYEVTVKNGDQIDINQKGLISLDINSKV